MATPATPVGTHGGGAAYDPKVSSRRGPVVYARGSRCATRRSRGRIRVTPRVRTAAYGDGARCIYAAEPLRRTRRSPRKSRNHQETGNPGGIGAHGTSGGFWEQHGLPRSPEWAFRTICQPPGIAGTSGKPFKGLGNSCAPSMVLYHLYGNAPCDNHPCYNPPAIGGI